MLIIDLVTSIGTLIWYILFTASNDDKAVQSDTFLLKKRLLCYARFLNILSFSLWSFIRPLLESVNVLMSTSTATIAADLGLRSCND